MLLRIVSINYIPSCVTVSLLFHVNDNPQVVFIPLCRHPKWEALYSVSFHLFDVVLLLIGGSSIISSPLSLLGQLFLPLLSSAEYNFCDLSELTPSSPLAVSQHSLTWHEGLSQSYPRLLLLIIPMDSLLNFLFSIYCGFPFWCLIPAPLLKLNYSIYSARPFPITY